MIQCSYTSWIYLFADKQFVLNFRNKTTREPRVLRAASCSISRTWDTTCEISCSHGSEYEISGLYDFATCSLIEVDRRFRGAHCHHLPDDRGSMILWNVGVLQRDYTALYPRLSCSWVRTQCQVRSEILQTCRLRILVFKPCIQYRTDSYSGSPGLKSRLGVRLSWRRFFVIFLSPSKTQDVYWKCYAVVFLRIISRPIVWATKTVLNESIQINKVCVFIRFVLT
jgi:hypothetical protein